ncbi:glycoside hydrolase [Rhizodiscina lignyota]|uniref:Beta-mannosidase B n=1 Tax=Rhizodiscina lignyota TaxID=1504668 RepID=A0A9P4M4X4_9PEZI|nr:glycoside hydrolase [Rhizodiscina lignyota]
MSVSRRSHFFPQSSWKWRLSSSNSSVIPGGLESKLEDWHACHAFPSVIHQELLHLSLIPDANVGENERLIQWVGKCDWEYCCTFTTPDPALASEHIELVCEGLDTFATATLNGQQILQSDNMFIPYRVDVKSHLRAAEQENELIIIFESAVKKGEQLEQEYGARFSMMRDKKRMHMRKAQYHWGWDWGPVMVTSGPYMPVYLETYTSRISDLHVITKLADDHSYAEINCEVTLSGSPVRDASLELSLIDQAGSTVSQTTFPISASSTIKLPTPITVASPKLWWPHLQGAQHLYTATARLLISSSTVLDTHSTRFGIRTITLIQRPLDSAPGRTFLFNVNGRDIFIQGGDWIPCDMLLPSISRSRYYSWIRLAQRCNLNMLRIWGGGIYESEDFFDACDELGILVWHDYAFACGDYPTHPSFLENVHEEAEAQTRRLRNRASLALLCGGNEDFMLADWAHEFGRKKIEYDHDDTEGPFLDTDFPQREIYLKILPKVAKYLAPSIPYWPNSPWGGSETANDPTIGDTHMWEVWHLKQLPYQQYKNLSSRFVSEFGMHGYPDMRTVLIFAPNEEDRHPQSKAIDCHNKGHGAEIRIARYLAENFRYSNKLEDFVYCSQLLQSEAYGYALRDWKRKFGGKGKEECAGAIIWQFNDVYPVTSWAFIDYYLRPKPAFYTIARAFAPVSIGIERKPWSRWIDEDKPREGEIPHFKLFAHNTSVEEVKAKLKIEAWDMHTQKKIDFAEGGRDIILTAGCNTELGELGNPESLTEESLVVLCAKLLDSDGKVLSRIVNWPEPYRYLRWPKDTKVQVNVSKDEPDWDAVTLEANFPVKGCFLSLDHTQDGADALEPIWEDNMLDLMPGERLIVRVKERHDRAVQIRFLNDWEL